MFQKVKEGLITLSKSSAKANGGREKATNGRVDSVEWLQLQGLKDSWGRIRPTNSVDGLKELDEDDLSAA